MRVYFLSDIPCAFFVNGMHLGTVDMFERSVELATMDGVFCEFKAPQYAPIRFRFDEDFLFSPPEETELYFRGGEVAVRLRGFVRADPSLRVVWQKHFSGCLMTLCVQGRVVLNFENERGFLQIPLPFSFEDCRVSPAGNFILLEGKGAFALLGKDGKLSVLTEGRVTERGTVVTAEVPFRDSLSHVARCTYENGRLTGCSILSAREPTDATIALALFESVLAGFDATPYLAPVLAPKAGLLREFLGDFRAVVPTQESCVVGLVYERKPRVFDVRNYRVTLEDGKVSNLTPL